MRRSPHGYEGCPGTREEDRRSSFASADDPAGEVVPVEVEAAIGDLERALRRDRSHAVVAVPPGPKGRLALGAFTKHLAALFRVVPLASPALEENEISPRILAELRWEAGHDPELSLLGFVRQLERRGSALVLLISDAGRMQEQTLRRLGRLAMASKSGLRLVLVVEVEPRSDGKAITELVAALGVGVQKVELRSRVEREGIEAPAPAPLEYGVPQGHVTPLATPRAPAPPAPAPRTGPVPSPERAGRLRRSPAKASRPWGLRGRFSRARRGPLLAAAAGGIALALVGAQLRSAPTPPREAVPAPVRIAEPSDSAGPPVSAAAESATSRPEEEPAAPADAARSAGNAGSKAEGRSPPKKSAAPATSVRTIRVSLNARPWARIQVDGREVGITPLANLRMAPGLHRFRAHLADGRVIERRIRIDAYHNHISFP